jgi:hypothetical protein
MIAWLLVAAYLAVGFVAGGFVARLVFESEQRRYPEIAKMTRNGDIAWGITCGVAAGLTWPATGAVLLGYHLLRRYWFGDVLTDAQREERERRIADRERDLGL